MTQRGGHWPARTGQSTNARGRVIPIRIARACRGVRSLHRGAANTAGQGRRSRKARVRRVPGTVDLSECRLQISSARTQSAFFGVVALLQRLCLCQKTAVDEDHLPFGRKYEIWTSGKVFPMQKKPKPLGMDKVADDDLALSVLPVHTCHQGASCRG